jgi:hypothetical protein
MPMLTLGSPDSRRIRVGTVTPRRLAHVARDSRRRRRATARSAPSLSSAESVEGGSCRRARASFGIQIDYIGYTTFVHFYLHDMTIARGKAPGCPCSTVWLGIARKPDVPPERKGPSVSRVPPFPDEPGSPRSQMPHWMTQLTLAAVRHRVLPRAAAAAAWQPCVQDLRKAARNPMPGSWTTKAGNFVHHRARVAKNSAMQAASMNHVSGSGTAMTPARNRSGSVLAVSKSI